MKKSLNFSCLEIYISEGKFTNKDFQVGSEQRERNIGDGEMEVEFSKKKLGS
jgi:hypothetical protein